MQEHSHPPPAVLVGKYHSEGPPSGEGSEGGPPGAPLSPSSFNEIQSELKAVLHSLNEFSTGTSTEGAPTDPSGKEGPPDLVRNLPPGQESPPGEVVRGPTPPLKKQSLSHKKGLVEKL